VLKRILGRTNAGTSAESNTDSLGCKGQQLADRSCRCDYGGSDGTSAEADKSCIGRIWQVCWVLAVVSNVVGKLGKSDHAAFKLRNLLAFTVVGVDEVPRCKEIRDLVPLCLGKLLDFIAENNTGTVEECCQSGIVSPCGHLLQEGKLISCLISEDEDVHDGGYLGSGNRKY
jgi:hypothetical protein